MDLILPINKGYDVYGLIRRKTKFDLGNVSIKQIKPDEVYYLAPQSFVVTSQQQPITTSEINGIKVIIILETIRLYCPHTKFYQASTSKMFGKCYYQIK